MSGSSEGDRTSSLARKVRPERGEKGVEATMAAPRPVAIGMRAHTGWAAVVALAGPADAPEVVAKRRLEMASTFDEGAVFHQGRGLPLARAEAFIQSSEERFLRLAREALAGLASELRAAGYEPVASALFGGARALPPLVSILKSHALVHAAEGELYRRVLLLASEACGIPARLLSGEALPAATRALRAHPRRLAAQLAAMGTASGRPWAQDQKESALAAWIALAADGATDRRRNR